MKKFLLKGISTPAAVAIIGVAIIFAVTIVIVINNYFSYRINIGLTAEQDAKNLEIEKQASEKSQVDFSKLNKNDLLHKLFPNVTFTNETANLVGATDYVGLKLSLKDSREDYFVSSQEKSLLLTANLEGVAHAGGLYHAYLGLFDKNGNLLTPSSTLSDLNRDYDFSSDKAQYGGDAGHFGFYDCKGIKYIAFVSSGCPNSSCCYDGAKLYRVNNGDFEIMQTINDLSLLGQKALSADFALKMNLSDDKIIIKKVPQLSDTKSAGIICAETDYKTLNWDKQACQFK
jgi:hypothetical protein